MKLVTVAQYDQMPLAYIAKGRLEAEGIPCLIADENLVQADWFYSLAVGGIKVQVEEEFVSRARTVLGTDYSASLPDSEDELEA